MFMHQKIQFTLKSISCIALFWGGTAAANPALTAASNGKPEALAAQIVSGQIPPNEYLKLSTELLPLCLLGDRDTPVANQAFEWLLVNGADPNKECRPTAQEPFPLPLDRVVYALSVAIGDGAANPARAAFLKGRVKRLLEAGASTDTGSTTYEAVAREVAYWSKIHRDSEAALAQWIREKNEETAATFRTILGFVALAAGAYAISKAGSDGSTALQSIATSTRPSGSAINSGSSSSAARTPMAGNLPAQSQGGLPPLLAQAAAAAGQPTGGSTQELRVTARPNQLSEEDKKKPNAEPQKPERKVYTFERVRNWQSPFHVDTEERAIEMARQQRADMEPNFFTIAFAKEVVNVGNPECRVSNPASKTPRYFCAIPVRYRLQSYSNPDGGEPSAAGNGTSR